MSDEVQANAPAGEPYAMSFRERKQQALEAERSEPEPEIDAVEETERQPDEAEQMELLDDEVDESQPAEEDEAGAVDEAELAAITPEVETELNTLRTERDQALEQRDSMEKSFRRKTHKLAETSRALESNLNEVTATAEYYSGLADQEMTRFQNVNWQQLAQQPEQYQQAQQAFAQAQQQQQQRRAELDAVRKRAGAMLEQVRTDQAQVSKAVLPGVIPGWSDKVYGDVLQHATEAFDYSSDEAAQITDWRTIKMLHDSLELQRLRTSSQKAVKRIGKKAKAPAGAAAKAPAAGSLKARLADAKARAFADPRDRTARLEMRKLQLEMESTARA